VPGGRGKRLGPSRVHVWLHIIRPQTLEHGGNFPFLPRPSALPVLEKQNDYLEARREREGAGIEASK